MFIRLHLDVDRKHPVIFGISQIDKIEPDNREDLNGSYVNRVWVSESFESIVSLLDEINMLVAS